MAEASLAGTTVGVTADRRWRQQADLFAQRGAAVLHGPSLRTVELAEDKPLRAATEELVARPPDVAVVTTGMGLRLWLEAAEGWGLAGALLGALGGARVAARGAKAASAVRAAGLPLWWRAPGENMGDVVAHVRAAGLGGARAAVQLFDPDDHPSTRALAEVVGELVEVPVYRWLLPADEGPARSLAEAAVAGRLGAVTFTSQPAVRNLFRIAGGAGGGALADELRHAFRTTVLAACVGPVCAEAARAEGIDRLVWADPPRLPVMVRQVAEALRP